MILASVGVVVVLAVGAATEVVVVALGEGGVPFPFRSGWLKIKNRRGATDLTLNAGSARTPTRAIFHLGYLLVTFSGFSSFDVMLLSSTCSCRSRLAGIFPHGW